MIAHQSLETNLYHLPTAQPDPEPQTLSRAPLHNLNPQPQTLSNALSHNPTINTNPYALCAGGRVYTCQAAICSRAPRPGKARRMPYDLFCCLCLASCVSACATACDLPPSLSPSVLLPTSTILSGSRVSVENWMRSSSVSAPSRFSVHCLLSVSASVSVSFLCLFLRLRLSLSLHHRHPIYQLKASLLSPTQAQVRKRALLAAKGS